MSVQSQAELYAAQVEKTFEILKRSKTGFFSSNIDLKAATNFLIQALDEAIKYAEDILKVGAEKKEFVLTVISRLYDTTISPYMPGWLYFFSSSIKKLVIDVIISNAIDWIVQKYKDGIWSVQK